MPEFANPFVNIVPRMLTKAELVQALRIDIAAEIEAINVYEAHFAATDDEGARRVLAHVIAEEKEHLAEFLEVVKMLDPEQVQYLEEAPADVTAIIAGRVSAADDTSPTAGTISGGPPSPPRTVGSLIDQQPPAARIEAG
ncbi:MAG: hypothetical protein EPO21_19845 [Chloroflexota bacterium]|nr:MAG: hypothetical protein EPO21_19845 [Chloroflexota bacterium]